MTSGMRILHVDSGREMRGGQWQVLQLMEELRRAGIAQKLLAQGGSPLFERARAASFDADPLSLVSLWRQSQRADLVHAHDARSHSVCVPFSSNRLVVSRRVAFPVKRSALSRWKYRNASSYLAVSNFVKQQLLAAGVPEEKIEVVYDGVRLPECPADQGIEILALDSADPAKGKSVIQRAAQIAGIPVRFSKDLMRDLPKAAVFVYVSDSEGLGSAALLAMAHGVPAVASNIGGLPEAVLDGETGLLIENDPAAIAACLQRLKNEEPLRRLLGRNGRERVARQFTMEHTAAQTLKAYQRLLAC